MKARLKKKVSLLMAITFFIKNAPLYINFIFLFFKTVIFTIL